MSKCGLISKETIPFDDILHFTDEENIATWVDFGCGITFSTENPTNVEQTNGQRENICRSCKKTECIPSNNQNNCFFDEEHASNVFLNPYDLRDMDPSALGHSNTLKIGTLSPISSIKQQLTDLKETCVHCSYHCGRWTVKEWVMRQFCIPPEKIPTGRTSEENSCYG